jgi:hypothetical protein
MKKGLSLLIFATCIIQAVSTHACTNITSNLSIGSKGQDVLALETFLADRGFLKEKPNTIFDQTTSFALKDYQKSANLLQSGALFLKTRTIIRKITCPVAKPLIFQASPITPSIASTTSSSSVQALVASSTASTTKSTATSTSSAQIVKATSTTPVATSTKSAIATSTAATPKPAVATTTKPVAATSTTTVTTPKATTTPVSSNTQPVAKPVVATTTAATTTKPVVIIPKPVVASVNNGSFILGATTTETFIIQGNNLATTTDNEIFLKPQSGTRMYKIGQLRADAVGGQITLQPTFTTNKLPCGDGCLEPLAVGTYEVIVKNGGGESGGPTVTFMPFTANSRTLVTDVALYHGAKHAELGTFAFSISLPVRLQAITITTTYDPADGASLSGIFIKDELKNATTTSLSLGDEFFSPGSSKSFTLYGDVTASKATMAYITPVISVKDAVTGRNSTIPIKPIPVSMTPIAY